MTDVRTNIIFPALIIIAGFGALFYLSNFLERNRPMLPDDYGDSDLYMNGSSLKGFALGMEGLIADWYFMAKVRTLVENANTLGFIEKTIE
jgi:hypothetical protein